MNEYYEIADKLLRELCRIPAPSHKEDRRAEYILGLLRSWGADGAYIDSAKNVIFELKGEGSGITVFAAHTDTVFPDMEPLPFSEDGDKIYCPGCGDDTAAVSQLLAVIKYIIDSGKKPKETVLFVLNSCEEGLGDLKGTKALMAKYGDRVKTFFTFDGLYNHVAVNCVGSHRYRVTVKTEGGHSFQAFGNKNAINILSKGVRAIYDLKVPEGGRTTYNVGGISGGTSVNTIAQNAEMLCEYRSDCHESLEYMKKRFFEIFDMLRAEGAEVEVETVGVRPCKKGIDEARQTELAKVCLEIQKKHSKGQVEYSISSTDCNVPLSMGINAICVGTFMGEGAHTREEWIEKASIPKGFEIVKELVENYF